MILGIDLGTTYSLAGIIKKNKPELVKFNGDSLLPSVVGFTPEGELLIGRAAKNQYYLHPERTVKSIKRKMGEKEEISLNGKGYLPEEISAIILRYIKEEAEKQFDIKINDAVITVPAYFSDDQRKATRIAGTLAGFNVKRIINEPTAASLVYNWNFKKQAKILVYDLGGGTFDVSIVNIGNSVVEVIASHGNNKLGGDDFDELLLTYILEVIKKNYKVKIDSEDKCIYAQLVTAAEKAKIELSNNPFAKIIENIIVNPKKPPLNIEIEISRIKFEELINKYINETIDTVHIALQDAKLNVSDIDQLILVGGSTKIPIISERLEELFRKKPQKSVDPDLGVCIGAGIQGAILENQKIDSILIDITPYTFGVNAVREDMFGINYDFFSPIIKRNTPLPVSKSEVFYKHFYDQKQVKVDIYEGENPIVSKNKFIGSFTVENLTKGKKNMEVIISMNLDINGILNVTAKEKNTGLQKNITIHNAFSHVDLTESKEKMKEIFGKTYKDEKEISQDAKTQNKKPEAQKNLVYIANSMIKKANKKMDKAKIEDAEDMKKYIELIKTDIEQNNMDDLKNDLDKLTDILFYID